jgi:anthranilate synthase component 1
MTLPQLNIPPATYWARRRISLGAISFDEFLGSLWEHHATITLLDRRHASSASGPVVIGLKPDITWTLTDGGARLEGEVIEQPGVGDAPADPLLHLEGVLRRFTVPPPPGLPSCVGGMIGYLGYGLVDLIHGVPHRGRDVLQVPDAVLTRPSVYLVINTVDKDIIIDICALGGAGIDANKNLSEIANELTQLPSVATFVGPHSATPSVVRPSMGEELYKAKFEAAMTVVKSGGATQIGLSQRFDLDFPFGAHLLYEELVRTNPSPLSFCMKFGDFSIVGTSPRILADIRGRVVTTRPIGGTTPRPINREDDAKAAASLLANGKEVEEHLMLFDCWYADLARIVDERSVQVIDRLTPEFFSHVIHIGSTLRGRLREDVSSIDVVRAVFPAPTVVGSPKVAAIHELARLEPDKRSIYGGCVGHFGAHDQMEMYVTIRSALLKNGLLHVQAGAGIVSHSDADYEYREMVNKAGAIVGAAEQVAKRGD